MEGIVTFVEVLIVIGVAVGCFFVSLRDRDAVRRHEFEERFHE